MPSTDASQVSERSRRAWAEYHPHLLNRTQIFGGSFLDPGSIPVVEETDCPRPAYLLRFILHDWETSRALEILRNVRHAMRDGACHAEATLIIVDQVSPACLQSSCIHRNHCQNMIRFLDITHCHASCMTGRPQRLWTSLGTCVMPGRMGPAMLKPPSCVIMHLGARPHRSPDSYAM